MNPRHAAFVMDADHNVRTEPAGKMGANMAVTRQNNPLLPAVIVVLLLALLIFLLVSRNRETGTSHPQPPTQNP